MNIKDKKYKDIRQFFSTTISTLPPAQIHEKQDKDDHLENQDFFSRNEYENNENLSQKSPKKSKVFWKASPVMVKLKKISKDSMELTDTKDSGENLGNSLSNVKL